MKIPDLQALKAPIERLELPELRPGNLQLDVLREDRLPFVVGGNKLRKLIPNLRYMLDRGYESLITYGGAYSNHIAAVASAGRNFDLPTIGVIRGEELASKWQDNPTLKKARREGMELHFVSRGDYRSKENSPVIRKIIEARQPCIVLPEGGTNELAVEGCETILDKRTAHYDYVCSAVGTGGTFSGLLRSCGPDQRLIGFSALDTIYQSELIDQFTDRNNYQLIPESRFGGYGKVNADLIEFINSFNRQYGIPLDPVYTGKLMYSLIEMIRERYFPENSRILVVHTGGLQGIEGMNDYLSRKGMPLIE